MAGDAGGPLADGTYGALLPVHRDTGDVTVERLPPVDRALVVDVAPRVLAGRSAVRVDPGLGLRAFEAAGDGILSRYGVGLEGARLGADRRSAGVVEPAQP